MDSLIKEKTKRLRKIIRRVWIILGLVFTLLLILSFQAKGVDDRLIESNNTVKVINDRDKMEFTPLTNTKETGLLFYPGGFVDPKAYVPMARKIAESGYKVVIVKLPLRTAFFESQKQTLFSRTKELIGNDDEIKGWVLAGHSRGGALASVFVKEEPILVEGLILIGTTHPKEFSLSSVTIDVTKIFATNDGLASEQEIKEYAGNLPTNTHWIKIDGGNHSQFGYYSFQLGDKKATITRDHQQKIVEDEILQALQRITEKELP